MQVNGIPNERNLSFTTRLLPAISVVISVHGVIITSAVMS